MKTKPVATEEMSKAKMAQKIKILKQENLELKEIIEEYRSGSRVQGVIEEVEEQDVSFVGEEMEEMQEMGDEEEQEEQEKESEEETQDQSVQEEQKEEIDVEGEQDEREKQVVQEEYLELQQENEKLLEKVDGLKGKISDLGGTLINLIDHRKTLRKI